MSKQNSLSVISNRISFGSPSQPEDLSQYNIAPLDLQASGRGYRQTVCHGKLCCEFYVKTKTMGKYYEKIIIGRYYGGKP